MLKIWNTFSFNIQFIATQMEIWQAPSQYPEPHTFRCEISMSATYLQKSSLPHSQALCCTQPADNSCLLSARIQLHRLHRLFFSTRSNVAKRTSASKVLPRRILNFCFRKRTERVPRVNNSCNCKMPLAQSQTMQMQTSIFTSLIPCSSQKKKGDSNARASHSSQNDPFLFSGIAPLKGKDLRVLSAKQEMHLH